MKWLKIIASILMVLLLVVVVAMVSLATFVSPNRFKPMIVEQVKKYTGREMVIDGDLSWTFFPSLGVKVGHLQLNNTSDFKQKIFAEVDSATLSVKLMPLFYKKIESTGITLKGLKLNLIKNEQGKANWLDLQKPKSETSQAVPQSPQIATGSPQRAAFGLAVNGIDLSDGVVHWEDMQAKQILTLNKLELHIKQIEFNKPIPFKTSFNFIGSNPNIQGNLSLTSHISINLVKQLFTLRSIDLNSNIKQDGKHFDITLKGDMSADLDKQKLQLDNLRGDISNLKFTGKMLVTDLTGKPNTKGHLNIQPLDVKKWLKDTGQDVAAVDTLSNLSGDFDFTAQTSLQSVDMKGGVKIAEIKSSKIHINNVDVRTLLQKGILTLAPITGDFYQGNLAGSLKVNLSTPNPQMAINAKLTNIQAEPLMADLGTSDKLKMTGTGNIDLQATTSGSNGDSISKNLNGNAKISFNNGILQGIDIGYIFDNAVAFARKHQNSGANSNQTPFGTLTATAVIRNGVVTNDDLKMDSPRFESTGKGTINLIAKTIHYQLQTKVKKTSEQRNELSNMYGLPIPIVVSGDLNNPHVGLDTATLMQAVATQQMQKAKSEVKEKIAEKIKDKLPGAAGDLLNSLIGN